MARRKSRLRRQGMTFIELLIVVSILSVVSAAMYATLASGIKIWQRTGRNIAEEDVCIFFDKFSADVRNCVKSQALLFSGDDDKFSFPTLINSPRLAKRTLGEAVYYFESSSGTLRRAERDVSNIYEDSKGVEKESLKGIRNLKFEYYYFSEEKQEHEWLPDWDKEGLPIAVRIRLEMANKGADEYFTKTVTIPVSR